MDNRFKIKILIFILFLVLILAIYFIPSDIVKIVLSVVLILSVGVVVFHNDRFEIAQPQPYPEIKKPEPERKSEVNFDREEDGFSIIGTITSPAPAAEESDQRHAPDDLSEKYREIADESIPVDLGSGGRFEFVLERVLRIIKDSYHAYSVIFLWYHKKNNVLTIEKGITTSTAVTNGSIVVADDILGKIVASGKPEILNDIPSAREAEAVRYYSRTQSIKSIVGVPVFYNDRLRGIVLIDSKESDIFGIETIYSLGRFVRLITILMQMFDERYSENISVQRLRALIEFLNPLSTVRKESEVIDIIENKIGELVQWDSFTLISYHAHMKEFFVEMAVKKPKLHYIDVETKIDLQGTIVGNCILSGKPQKINDISAVPMPRFTLSENIVFNGSFLCVPLIYQNKNYGVLCFESLRKSFYSVDDLNFLQSIGSILAFVMYSYTTQTLLRQISAYDLETNLFNEKIFQILMEHEFYRCKETSLPAVLVYIHIDETPEQATLFGGSPFMKMVAALAKILSDDAVPNSYCAKLGERKFGVYFFNASVADIHVWAERIRAKITKLNQHSFAKNSIFTVSMGITAFHERKSLDEVFQLAQHALDKAIELGGNKIIR